MRLYEVKYEDKDGQVRRKFASSDGDASKLSTKLKVDGDAKAKPVREQIEVPTDKVGLLGWLNDNATFAGDK